MMIRTTLSALILLASMSAFAAEPETQILECASVDNSIKFTVAESLVNGVYDHSGSILEFKGISYRINKFQSGYDQNVGQTNIATVFGVSIPGTRPSVDFAIWVPREGNSLKLKQNVSTEITVDHGASPALKAVCHTL